MMFVETATMQIFAEAMAAAQRGDKAHALELADRYAIESARSFDTADANGLAIIIAPLVNLYSSLGEWQLAVLKSRDVCALAEKLCPHTYETGGDYWQLAIALENVDDLAGAILALESAKRHMEGADRMVEYETSYQLMVARLRQKLQEGSS